MEQTGIQAVVFDLGGVLLRTDDPRLRRELAESLGRTYAQLDEIVFNNPVARQAESGQATPEQVWAEVARMLNLTPEQVPDFRSAFFSGDRVDFPLVNFIGQIRGKYRTGLLSNTWIRNLEQFVYEELSIPRVFDVVISSARSGRAKPGTEIFMEMLAALDVRAEETVFVDDNFENVAAAARLGIHAVRFLDPSQLRHDLLTFLTLPGMEAGSESGQPASEK